MASCEKALAACEQELKLKPDDPEAWYRKGIALDNLNHYELAIIMSHAPTQRDARSSSPQVEKTIPPDISNRYEEALAAYTETLRLKPDFAEAWDKKGVALDNLNRCEEALSCFEEALRLKPDFAEAWDNKGVAVGNLRNNEEALQCFEEAIRLEPNYVPAWYHKGVALENLGRHEEARSIEASLRLRFDMY